MAERLRTEEQGAAAARSPTDAEQYETVPYFWSDWYGHRLQFVGLPSADEVEVVRGDVACANFLALYRHGNRITGALGLNQRRLVMRLRSMIGAHASWTDALEFVEQT